MIVQQPLGVHSLPEHSMIFVKIWSRRSTTSSDSSAMEALEASTRDYTIFHAISLQAKNQ